MVVRTGLEPYGRRKSTKICVFFFPSSGVNRLKTVVSGMCAKESVYGTVYPSDESSRPACHAAGCLFTPVPRRERSD